MVKIVKEETPVGKTKKLIGGIQSYVEQSGSDFSIGVESTAPHTIFVIEGTGIYGPGGGRIYPRSAQALRFEWHGGIVFYRSVAGQKPNPFMDRAVARIEGSRNVEEAIEQNINL